MAIVATAVKNDPNYKSWTLTAAADGDTTLVLPHGFGSKPDFAIINSLLAASATDGVNQLNVIADATNLTVTKTTASGSGGGTPGTTPIGYIYCMRPNTSIT